jgi:D-alanyl-lipoteichoic acid acyltransferase DltB (MBOAT superfamily)
MLFALQIYCDFAGYTDIARGVSRLLGIELLENFNHPYFARNITDFWRRWHISLSTWLRDYLYIPLGGNRGPPWFVYRNLMLTMLLGGLWHGASWTFVVWGGIHGLALAVHKLWMGARGTTADTPGTRAGRIAAWLATLLVVCFAWVFFRAPDFATAFQVLSGIASLRGGFDPRLLLLPASALLLMMFLDVPQARARDHVTMLRWPWALRSATYVALVMALVLFRTGKNVPFIYFQF